MRSGIETVGVLARSYALPSRSGQQCGGSEQSEYGAPDEMVSALRSPVAEISGSLDSV